MSNFTMSSASNATHFFASICFCNYFMYVSTHVDSLTRKCLKSRISISSAILYSLAETAKANVLKPSEYFKYLLESILDHLDDTPATYIDDLMPWSDSIPGEYIMPIPVYSILFDYHYRLYSDYRSSYIFDLPMERKTHCCLANLHHLDNLFLLQLVYLCSQY